MHSKLLKAVSCGLAIGLACTSTSAAEVIFRDKFEQYSLEGFGTPQEGWAIVNSPIRSGNYAASHTLQPAASQTKQSAASSTLQPAAKPLFPNPYPIFPPPKKAGKDKKTKPPPKRAEKGNESKPGPKKAGKDKETKPPPKGPDKDGGSEGPPPDKGGGSEGPPPDQGGGSEGPPPDQGGGSKPPPKGPDKDGGSEGPPPDKGGGSGGSSGKGGFSVRGEGRDIKVDRFKGKERDLQPGKFYTIRASIKVTGDTSGGVKLLEVHKRRTANDPNGKQPFFIGVQRNQWVAVVYGGKRWTLGQVDQSRYTDWVVRIKLSTGQDGVVEVTKDGNRVVSYHGPNNAVGNPPGYLVWGAYSPRHSKKPEGDGRVTAYYDSVSISGG